MARIQDSTRGNEKVTVAQVRNGRRKGGREKKKKKPLGEPERVRALKSAKTPRNGGDANGACVETGNGKKKSVWRHRSPTG